MESRKITVYQTKNQSKKTIMSAATTLAELKADLRANDIDYDGMTFFEGTSKVELKDDNSVLPHDVPYKGQITNELVFMLTNTNKKIKSGVVSTRGEAYAAVKSMNLGEEIKKKYGKNYTNLGTAVLVDFINSAMTETISEDSPKPEVAKAPSNTGVDTSARLAITKLAEVLANNGDIMDFQYQSILDILNRAITVETPKSKDNSPYSDAEVKGMFDGWTE